MIGSTMAALRQFQYHHYFQPKAGLITLPVVPHTVIFFSGLWHRCRPTIPAVHWPYWWHAIPLHAPSAALYPVLHTWYHLQPTRHHPYHLHVPTVLLRWFRTIAFQYWHTYGACYTSGTKAYGIPVGPTTYITYGQRKLLPAVLGPYTGSCTRYQLQGATYYATLW